MGIHFIESDGEYLPIKEFLSTLEEAMQLMHHKQEMVTQSLTNGPIFFEFEGEYYDADNMTVVVTSDAHDGSRAFGIKIDLSKSKGVKDGEEEGS